MKTCIWKQKHRCYLIVPHMYESLTQTVLLWWWLIRTSSYLDHLCNLPPGHPYQVKVFCGRCICHKYGWATAWCKCFCGCSSMTVMSSDTRYTHCSVYPTKFRKDQSCWCNLLPRKQCMAKGVSCFCLFLLPYTCSFLSCNVRYPMN